MGKEMFMLIFEEVLIQLDRFCIILIQKNRCNKLMLSYFYYQFLLCNFPHVHSDAKIWKVDSTCFTLNQGLVKGAILCFRNLYFYIRHGESTSTASQLTSPASQKSKDLNKVLLHLQDLGSSNSRQGGFF